MKKKTTIEIRLYDDELRLLNESLKSGINSLSWTIIAKAYKRKDVSVNSLLDKKKKLNNREAKNDTRF